MRKTTFGIIFLVAAGAAWAYAHWHAGKPAVEPPHSADQATLRRVAQGQLVGYLDAKDTYAWAGIPYAAPPVGDLRWRAPRPPQGWSGVREALKFGNFCPQFAGGAIEVPKEQYGNFVGDEDCLFLNVWTPRIAPDTLAATHLPVMVWIHGGANTAGSGSMYRQIRNLVKAGNVIAVTLNYRLGPLGWISHPALSHAADSIDDRSGNYGTLDTIAALRWVKDNIAAFGGDPDNVTVFGESAGGSNVFALLASPAARGLFAKAIAQSGVAQTYPLTVARNLVDDAQPGNPNSSRELINKLLIADGLARDRAEAVQKQAAMTDAQIEAYLRGKSAAQLLAPFAAAARSTGFGFYHAPAILRDGAVIPDRPLREVFTDAAHYNAVPVILGTNRDEMKLFMMGNPELVDKWFGKIPRIKDPARYNRETAYFSDQWKARGVDEPAAAMRTAQGPSVFAYRFDWSEEPQNFIVDLKTLLGASHGTEVFFLFGDYADEASGLAAIYTKDNYAGRKEVSDAMASYWTQFAYSGNPGRGRDGRLPEWKTWSEGQGDKYIVLDTTQAGGIRMASQTQSDEVIKQRLLADQAAIGDQQRLCGLYARLFKYSFNANFEAWREDEYKGFGAKGCGEWPVGVFGAEG